MRIYELYSEITDIINKSQYKKIGVEITEDTYEYPLYVMIHDVERLEHVNVNNSTSDYYDKTYVPEVVISNISHEEKHEYNEKEYKKIYDKLGYAIYELNN